ncbi:hypothetical protein G6011_04107 [Alternaria panax]|uniref:Cupin type-1 domain-containing protein n=1 Tax=Alternaria panax TaxID=48097 RepID=A0AAD4IGE9_9PLEO|nr:hypothetical protein G6011_04107 [Alternaria panax]
MPIKVKSYKLSPTPLIPNSPYPLLHYPGLLHSLVSSPTFKPTQILDLYASNGWQTQWIAKYGLDIQSHYHSTTHEAMTAQGKQAPGDRGADGEEGGLDIEAALGDVFIIPAGVSHKTFLPRPHNEELGFYQPRDIEEGRAAEVDDEKERERRRFFEGVVVEKNFMMMGAYPYGGVWDFAVGGEHGGKEGVVWGVEVPGRDPVLGGSEEGLLGLWKGG